MSISLTLALVSPAPGRETYPRPACPRLGFARSASQEDAAASWAVAEAGAANLGFGALQLGPSVENGRAPNSGGGRQTPLSPDPERHLPPVPSLPLAVAACKRSHPFPQHTFPKLRHRRRAFLSAN